MKTSLLFLILFTLINIIHPERIVLHTIKESKIYLFFPLKCPYIVFSVKATNDIHITLTDTHAQQGTYYEIVIGGWSNSRSIIRKDDQANEVALFEGRVIKNVFEKYWLSINDTAKTISIGKWNKDAFMHFRDKHYEKMSYFGVATGFGSSGEWHIDSGYLSCDLIACNIDKLVDIRHN